MTSPFIPCPFQYNDAPAGGSVMPMVIAARAPSNTIDKQYSGGYFWLSDLSLGGSGNLYFQGGFSAGVPAWTLISSSSGNLDSLSDGSTTVLPIGGNIAIVGTTNQITATGSAPSHQIALSIPSTFIAPGSIASTTTITAATDLISTNGNVQIVGAGKGLQINGGAVTDMVGTATLVNGTVTVANTNIATGDLIFLSRVAVNASTILGVTSYTISNGVSFTINSLILGTPGSLQVADQSSIAYFIVRAI